MMDIYNERDFTTFLSFGLGYLPPRKVRLIRFSIKDKKFYVSLPQIHNK